jgi:small subunit ribosomal protein S9
VTPDAPPVSDEPVTVATETTETTETLVTEPQPAPQKPGHGGAYWGTGRRKTSVARVRVKPGSGKVQVNKRDIEVYFTELQDRNAVLAPLKLTDTASRWDVFVNVRGGGTTGQSNAIRMGLARALTKADPSFEVTLRDAGLLTRDARKVERKKYGHRKARRSFQFSKR